MRSTSLAFTASFLAIVRYVSAQGTATSSANSNAFTPHAAKKFSYDNLPYKADTVGGIRGPQYGYNRCNSTTEGPTSLCQTGIMNSIDDFCLWGPPEPNSVVGNTEGEMVAFCTKPGRGSRLIPPGALTGVQFTRTPSYVQVVGFVDQTKLNVRAGDYGGEMDPHGADQRGNPIGGLLYSQAFGTNSTTGNRTFTQVMQWHLFLGANMFCLKACNPANSNDWRMCEHIYDRIGCAYNAPANYGQINGTFQSCAGDDQLFPGVYIQNGQTRTYTQPPESEGIITYIPYQAAIPSSSQCTTYTSSLLYAGLSNATATPTSSSSRASVTSSATSLATLVTGSSVSRGVAGAAAAPTTSSPNSAPSMHAASVFSAVLSLAASLLIFA